MANGPLGGFMPTPASPSQPPQVKLDTTALSRGTFNNFLKNMGGASTPPIMTAPSMGAINPLQMAPAFSDIDIFNPPMQMMAGGGNVAPRQTEIMGQPHMLAYITPEEGGILKALGGAGKPGPMGIPAFFGPGGPGDDGTDPSGDPGAGVDGPSGESDGGASSDPSGTGADDGVSDDDPDNTDYSDIDDSAPDDDIDYTDPDYGYTTVDPDTGKSDMDIASEIGRAVSQAQANAAEIQNRALAAKNKQNVQTAINQNKANQQSLIDAQLGLAKGSTTPGAMVGGPPQGSGMTSNVVGASTTNFSNIGTKGLADDPLGLSLQGVGLGPDIATPNIGPSVQSGPNTNADITGFGGKGGRDVSDFSTDIDALADVEEQAKKGSFPAFDKVPGFIGTVLGLVNQATKTGAQNTLSNISKGFAPTYGPDGSITGTTGFGIGMGQPGGLFGGGRSVENYDVFDDTSPSIGMYSEDRDIGGNESDPITLKRRVIPVEEEEEKSDAPPSILGAAMPSGIGSAPFIVESPFTTNVGDFRGTGFDAGDLNALIAQITRQQLPRAMAKGGVARFANGGLIQAVDDFLSTGT